MHQKNLLCATCAAKDSILRMF
ncbi:unnamed protein product [Larinioides sclopetarius]|uniref:Uncharacterized protein n=1 Tax=Larinioides sclopetarius TaxID=280406 RepID=A0AAV2AZP8_9ARAC